MRLSRVLLGGILGVAVLAVTDAGAQRQVVLTAGEVGWKDGPASLPAGAKFAVLDGDPSKAEIFILRLWLPANYKIPPHFHSGQERVTVISGTFHLGHGESFDAAKARELSPGSYFSLPAGMPHFAWTSTETVVQLSSLGPWTLTYVNPADDPRRK